MNILVFNCGSSSLKYRLIAMPEERELAGGEAQRVGPKTGEPARIYHRVAGRTETHFADMADHGAAFREVMKLLQRAPELRVDVAGHRVVHGGDVFPAHSRVDEEALARLEPLNRMAPIHNPPAVSLVRAIRAIHPDLPQVLVFDTAFHATIPEPARTYALPRDLREELGIRKYGFHGISHQYVAAEAAKMLRIPAEELNAVSCHLGSGGASLCAIVGGRSVENTMGYSPLQGLIMSTRTGDLDPGATMHLLARAEGDCEAVEQMLNKRAGVLGLSGISADIRDVLPGPARKGEDPARLDAAVQTYLWRIRKYLGAYLTLVGAPRAVIFTDTIGETVPYVRWAVCAGMEAFGLKIDAAKNEAVRQYPADVAAADSAVRVLVILTNEELSIARATWKAMN